MDNTEKTALKILDKYIDFINKNLSKEVEAVILVGSLASGSYVPGPGDIDQITIIKNNADLSTTNKLTEYIQKSMKCFNNSVKMTAAIYNFEDLNKPWFNNLKFDNIHERYLVDIPVELQRIHDHSKVVYGNNNIYTKLSKPSMQDMIDYTVKRKEWSEIILKKYPIPNYESTIKNPSLRIAVQTILCKAIVHYYFLTGKSCGNKHIITTKLRLVENYRFIATVGLAAAIRMSNFADISPERESQLREGYFDMLAWSKSNVPGQIALEEYKRNLCCLNG